MQRHQLRAIRCAQGAVDGAVAIEIKFPRIDDTVLVRIDIKNGEVNFAVVIVIGF